MITRRRFLRYSVIAGVAAAIPLKFRIRRAEAFVQSPSLRKFITTLPGLDTAGANNIGQYLPLATKTTATFAGLSTDVYKLAVAQFTEKMHPDLPGSTQFWGYHDLATRDRRYLGGVIVASRGRPVLLNVTNRLPARALIPVDPTQGAGPHGLTVGRLPMNRAVTHLHGGLTPWFSDGTPFQWSTPYGLSGPSFMNVPGTHPPLGTATYYYPMDQSARFVWYHDHAMGITRTNVYAGLASALILTDDFEISLVNQGLLPDLIGTPLIIQDKSFVPKDIDTVDPDWFWGPPGSLWYPHTYEPNQTGGSGRHPSCSVNPKGRWDYGPCLGATLPKASDYRLPVPASIVPEAFFDTILVNGGVYPVANVPAKRIRVRLLNGSQARFLHLNLYPEQPSTPGEAMVGTPGPIIYQVGTEGGFLPAVAVHDNTTPIPLIEPGHCQS